MADCVEALLVLVLLCRNEMEEMGRLYYQLYSRYMLHSKLLYNRNHQLQLTIPIPPAPASTKA